MITPNVACAASGFFDYEKLVFCHLLIYNYLKNVGDQSDG